MVYLMKYRIQKVEMLKEFISEVQKQLGKSINALRLYQSEEYLNQGFQSYLRDNKILSMDLRDNEILS